ncbi:hypothetical protein GF407_16415 [candidate division KSB1 bacterium]|nr:hypothetical protein [candidate division KSB1 bacterium]
MKTKLVLTIAFSLLFLPTSLLSGKTKDDSSNVLAKYNKIVFGCYSNDLEEFKSFAEHAKQLGATHITITAEDLPIRYWELKPPEDPYPAWVITNPGLLKLLPPEPLKPYIPLQYGQDVIKILQDRCAILRSLDLKATFHTFEPQMLPKAFFEEHPLWRGPQVDNPMRARVSRFAPSISNPQVLELYRQGMGNIIEKCPDIEILQMRTNDSGAGIEWSKGLYAGKNGNTLYRSMDMEERIYNFFAALQSAAAERGNSLDVHMYNSKEDDKAEIARHLDAGMALDNYEGPDASRFKNQVGTLLYYRRAFAPVPGIPWPLTFVRELGKANRTDAGRLYVSLGDRHNKDLYMQIFQAFVENPVGLERERLSLLHGVAQSRVGAAYAGHLLDIWLALDRCEASGRFLSMGGTMFILGCVHQRWLVRPFVPFPKELTREEKEYYRKHQFQSRSEEHARDLLDLQATRFIEGFSGYRFVHRILHSMQSEIRLARRHCKKLTDGLSNEKATPYRLLDKRLQVFSCLIDNVDNTTAYQVHLDRFKALADSTPVEMNPPYPFLRPDDIWSRQELMRIAREEMDNTARLIDLLQSESDESLLDRAKKKDEEYHRLLGPDMIDQLHKKLKIMRSHWEDYNRIWTN